MMPNGLTSVLPIEYPRVKVGGKPYEMRFTQASPYLMQLWKLPIKTLSEWIHAEFLEGRGAAAQLAVAATCLGNIGVDGEWEPLALEPVKLAARLLPSEWAEIGKAYVECMAKVSPPTASLPAPEAKAETGNIQ